MKQDVPIMVRLVRHFAVSPEQVFDAFLNPDLAGRFMFAAPAGRMVRVEIEPFVGGSFMFVDRRDGQDVVHSGRYIEIARPHCLVFSFSVDGSAAQPDRVTIEIRRSGSGSELTLTHEIKPEWADYADRTESGWSMILAGLGAVVAKPSIHADR